GPAAGGVDVEPLERGVELLPGARHEAGRATPGPDGLGGGDEAGGLERGCAADRDEAGGDELAGTLAAGGEAPTHELHVEAAADGRRRRPPRQPGGALPAPAPPDVPDDPPAPPFVAADRLVAALRVDAFPVAAFPAGALAAGALFAVAFFAAAFFADVDDFLAAGFPAVVFFFVLFFVAFAAGAVADGASVTAAGASGFGPAPPPAAWPVAWPTNERAVSRTRWTIRSMSSRVARSRREICWSISDRTVSRSRSRLWRLRSSSSSTADWACSACTAPARTRSRTSSSARWRVSAVKVMPASRSRLSRSFSAIPREVTAGRARWQCPPPAWRAWARRRRAPVRPAGPAP